MLHRNRELQDENDLAHLRGKIFGTGGNHTGKKSLLGPGKRAFDAENPGIGKLGKAPNTVPRKALGDITNATPARNALRQNKTLHGQPSPAVKQTVKPAARAREDIWAEDGIERMAGKCWKDQQLEMQQKENLEIKAKVLRGCRPRQELGRFQTMTNPDPWRKCNKITTVPPKPPSVDETDGLSELEDIDFSVLDFSFTVPCSPLAIH